MGQIKLFEILRFWFFKNL